MYRRHRLISYLLIGIVFLLGMGFNLRYSMIANVVVTVISIALAVYISVSTSLLGSPYSKALKKLPDKDDPTKSMLGVFAKYLKVAKISSLLSIIVSSIYLLKPDTTYLINALKGGFPVLQKIVSACACSLFAYNVFLMSLILDFMIVALMNAATITAEDSSVPQQVQSRNDRI